MGIIHECIYKNNKNLTVKIMNNIDIARIFKLIKKIIEVAETKLNRIQIYKYIYIE